MAKGLSRMKGNLHVRFLGGWRVATLSGYPVGRSHCPNKAMASDWAKPHASLTWPLLTPQYCL